MPLHVPSILHPSARDGYWSPVTSTINWCEEDYLATTYCAELVNSFTNLAFVYLAYKGISSCIRNGHDTIFLVSFISYLIIGLGSFIFHSTLKYETQLLDELAMIYTACIMFYAIFSWNTKTATKILIALFDVALAVFITLVYHYLKNPVFHQNAFSLLIAIVLFRSIYLMETSLRPPRRNDKIGQTKTREQMRRDERDLTILRTMWQMISVGLVCFVIGFTIWNLDNIYCSNIRRWRHEMGLPWGILLEGHGWWHIFTGIAQYHNLTWGVWLRYCLDGRQDEVTLVWPSRFTSMPSLERNKKSENDSLHQNLTKKSS